MSQNVDPASETLVEEAVQIPRWPTEAMMDAGLYHVPDVSYADLFAAWRAMFDAVALDGGTSDSLPAATGEDAMPRIGKINFRTDETRDGKRYDVAYLWIAGIPFRADLVGEIQERQIRRLAAEHHIYFRDDRPAQAPAADLP